MESLGGTATRFFEGLDFLGSEYPRTGEEAHPAGCLERKTSAASFNYIEGQVSVLPGFELPASDVELAPFDLSEEDVALTDPKLSDLVTHRRASIAATSRLVEDQRSMLLDKFTHEVAGLLCDIDTFCAFLRHQKNPIGSWS